MTFIELITYIKIIRFSHKLYSIKNSGHIIKYIKNMLKFLSYEV